MVLEDDLTGWDYWWELNKNPYLIPADGGEQVVQTGSDDFYLGSTRIRTEGRDSLEPSERDLTDTILPALKRAIDADDSNRDIATSCMIAMAKIGQNHPTFDLIDVFAPRLKRADQEVRETAALAIGIAAIDGKRELDLLIALANDEPAGRLAAGRSEVEERTRAFAAYGLGLMGHRAKGLPTRFRISQALTGLIAERTVRRDLKVAAIQGISLLAFDATRAGDAALLGSVLRCLEVYYLADLGPGEQIAQSHCPTAMARLIRGDERYAPHCRELLARTLVGGDRASRVGPDLCRSCALALGQLCRPCTSVDAKLCPDAVYSELLLKTYLEHHDQQTRYFAILALGQIGGVENRAILLRQFGQAKKATEKPWCALALGLLARGHAHRAAQHGEAVKIDRLVGQTLYDALQESKSPDLCGALAVSLGLARFTDAQEWIRDMLGATLGQPELGGHLCISLALLEDRRSLAALREVARNATRQPELLRQVAIAIGHIGDIAAASDLHDMLARDETNVVTLGAIASALAFVGDRRSIDPLVRLLSDDQASRLARAFAAVALGGIADKEVVPWSTKISCGINYRASTETLSDQNCGILDIL